MAATYHAIVLGSGPSELVCANLIARSGAKVLVLERSAFAGGVAALREIAPGYHAAIAPAEAGHMSIPLALELGLPEHGFDPKMEMMPLVSVDAERAPLVLSRDAQATRASIGELSQNDAQAWEGFSARMARLAGFLESLYETEAVELVDPAPSELMSLASHGLRLRRMGKADMIEMLRILPMSLADLLDDTFESDRLKAAVASTGLASLFQGPRSAGTGFSMLHHLVGREPGAFGNRRFAKSEGAHYVSALLAAAAKRGVEIKTNADAKVVVENGRVAGVTAFGETFAAHVVVSGADPKRALLGDLAPWHLPPEVVRRVEHVKLRGVRAVMTIAVDALPSFAHVDGKLLRGTLVVAPKLDALERAYDAAKHGGMSDAPLLEITIPSLHASDLAPAGKHVVHVAAQYAPYRLRQAERGWDEAARATFEKRILDALERHAPGFERTIVAKQLFLPTDLEREYGLTEGHLYGGELTLDQILFMRPVAGWAHYETPVPGYFLCGDATHPGGALGGLAGKHAAGRVIKKLRG